MSKTAKILITSFFKMSSDEQEMVVEVLKKFRSEMEALQTKMEALETTEFEARKIMDDVESRDEMVARAIHDVSLEIRAIVNRMDVWERKLNAHAGKIQELGDKVVQLEGLYARLTMEDTLEKRVANLEGDMNVAKQACQRLGQQIDDLNDQREYCEVTLDEHVGRIEGVEAWLNNIDGRLDKLEK